MKPKIPILIILIIGLFLFGMYSIKHNKYSEKSFNDTLTVQQENVTEIKLSDLSGNERSTKNPEQIKLILHYLDQFRYKRLINDQTAYMPTKASIIYIYADDQVDFIVPYGKEAMISYKVYQVKNGIIDQEVLLDLYHFLPEK